MDFAPGPLSRKQADRLNELSRQVGALRRIAGVPPVNISRGGDGQPIIGLAGGGGVFSGARVTHSTTQTINTIGTYYLEFDTETYDTDDYHSTTSNNSRLVVPAAGYYHVGACVFWTPENTGWRFVGLVVNRTTNIAADGRPSRDDAEAGADPVQMTICTDYLFADGDYVEVAVDHDAGVDVSTWTTHKPKFWIHRLS